MKKKLKLGVLCAAAALLGALGSAGRVAMANGIPIGSSSLIGTLDYSDPFDTSYHGAVSPYTYTVENSYGNPSASWASTSNLTFQTPGTATDYPASPGNSGGSGQTTGVAQITSGHDLTFAYGSSSDYVVQADGILTNDRLDIVSLPAAGDPIIGTADGLSVFFRATTENTYGEIGIYNGKTETQVIAPGTIPDLTAGTWHNFAVEFNQGANTLNIYVDQTLEAHLNLATFAGGAYETYSNAAVGIGGASGNSSTTLFFDNFQVGSPAPEPSTYALSGMAGVCFLFRHLRQKRRRAGMA